MIIFPGLLGSIAANVTPSVVLDGIMLYLDAGNLASYSGSGTTWYDLSGYGRNTSLNGSMSYTSSSGGILNFNGTDTYAASIYNDNLTTNFTVSSWFKVSTFQNGRFLISKSSYYANSVTDFPFSLEVANSPSNSIFANFSSGDDFSYDTRISSSINSDTWYNVSVTYDQSIFKMYINGVLISSANSNISLSSNSQYWTIGRAAQENVISAGSSCFSGSVSNVLIYNRSLSQQEITKNFNALKNRFGL